MRKRALVLLDDFDGTTPAAETVSFAIDGVSYEMDLSAENAAEWREYVAPYVAVARRVRTAKPNGDTAKIRAWAAEQKIDVKPKGKIPDAVVAQYRAAQA